MTIDLTSGTYCGSHGQSQRKQNCAGQAAGNQNPGARRHPEQPAAATADRDAGTQRD
jgi:hypothetical protein